MKTDWTYGAEHEWADWPLERELPPGYGRDLKDVTIVNSNGVANDPRGVTCQIGGEINTRPTSTMVGQVQCLLELQRLLPEAKVNYRSNLHLHIRVPGLADDLDSLKRVQRYIHEAMPRAFPIIQPLPRPMRGEDAEEVHKGALRRWRRRRVSHQTLLTSKRLGRQLVAETVDEFMRWEVPESRQGTPLWHFQPRLCVNLRQLRETDTIEFRHFAGTMSPGLLLTSFMWCADFLGSALSDDPIEHSIEHLLNRYRGMTFPPWPEYSHWHEVRYRATCHDHSLSRHDIQKNVEAILGGTYGR